MAQKDYMPLANGARMPLIGLGTWQADDPAEIERGVDAALAAGYRHFDTATLYQNEAELGKVFKKWIDAGKVKREELFIVTKLPWTGMAPERVKLFIDLSLKKLQLDYIDLYLVHWPLGLKFRSVDELVPTENGKILYDKSSDLEAVWKELEKYVESGKLKAIGISNFNEKQIGRVMKIAKIPPANHQVEIQVYFQNRKLRDISEKHGITMCAYGPLGSPGRNSDKFEMSFVVPNLLQDPVVLEIAKKHGKTAGQVLLRFLTQQNIAAIPKSTNPQRIQENINIFDFQLSNIDMRRLEGLDKGDAGRSFPGFPDMKNHPECPWFM